MINLQDYIQQVESLETDEQAHAVSQNPLSEAYELGWAKSALYGAPPRKPPELLRSGAFPLFAGFYYAWGGLPYPKEHAVFALQLKALGFEQHAKKMACFQQAMLDSTGKVIPSFYAQEQTRGYYETTQLSKELIEECAPDSLPAFFVDEELGFARQEYTEGCALFFGSGCLSGQGAFLSRQGGVVNFGPQTTPLGDCSGFGIAGSAKQFQVEEKRVSALSTLGKECERSFVLPQIKEAELGTQWLKAEADFEEDLLSLTCTQQALYKVEPITYALYLKGECCAVSKLHRLKPRSLDRYQGPPGEMEVGGVRIQFGKGVESLEVRPLAGDESFWGADFVALLTVKPSFTIDFSLSS